MIDLGFVFLEVRQAVNGHNQESVGSLDSGSDLGVAQLRVTGVQRGASR